MAVDTTGPIDALPQGLIMRGGLIIPEDEVQEFKDRIVAAGGWCAPREIIYGGEILPLSPTGVVPELQDLIGPGRDERVERWNEEDEWLRQQTKLATMPLPEVG